MPINKILIANRGEIAIRIIRAARELGIASVAIHSADDATSLHVRRADESHALEGVGSRAYLDIDGVIEAAQATGCDALHPGYGFLAESPDSRGAARRRGSASSGRRWSRWSCSATRRGPGISPWSSRCPSCSAAPAR